MNPKGLDRREFHQLTLAALSGVVAGTAIGCSGGGNGAAIPAQTAKSDAPAADQMVLTATAEEYIMDEPHTCRGLNSCKGLGRSKENACAGQGTCASIADASCGGHNECKGQGGCHIPLMEGAWQTARAAFEMAMKKHGKQFGAAPAN